MSSQNAYTWVISTNKLDIASTAEANVHVQGEASGEHLTILKGDKSSLGNSLLENAGIKSVLSYTEVPGLA